MKRVGDVLSLIFDEKLMHKAKGYSVFFSCWKDLAEKNGIAAAADHSWIKSVDRGIVWIEVDHPGWKQILQTKESKLLSDFRYRFPDMNISGLSIMLARPGFHPASEANPAEPIIEAALPEQAPPPAPSAAAAVPPEPLGYGAIADGALKDVLMRLEKSIADKEAGQ